MTDISPGVRDRLGSRHRSGQGGDSGQDSVGAGRLVPLTRCESLALLTSVALGRIVFTMNALPAIRPVNHLVCDDHLYLRSHEGAAIVPGASATSGVVVAYEADEIDPVALTGWSVIVTGRATIVHDHEVIEPCLARLSSWVAMPLDYLIRIEPDIVHGYRLQRD